MSEPLSKVFQLERKEAQPAPHQFINTHEDYCEGYNQCVIDLDQLSPDVNKLKEILDYYNLPENGFYTDVIAQEIINKISVWIVKKG